MIPSLPPVLVLVVVVVVVLLLLRKGTTSLAGCTIYASSQPCPMCTGEGEPAFPPQLSRMLCAPNMIAKQKGGCSSSVIPRDVAMRQQEAASMHGLGRGTSTWIFSYVVMMLFNHTL